MKIVDRIKKFIEHKELSLRRFDESIGMSKGYMSRQIKANASIGSDVLERMLDTYPELNPIWLLKGEGEMLLPNGRKVSEPSERYYTYDDLASFIVSYLDHPMVSERLRSIIQEETMSDHDKLAR
ncbi:hypothetical protein [Ascidiimonas aurantiaca]|uniref:hypothetical protein n=1 Tax=Ascidiimonas aurantiaca TaxID=1685432 RepID=UPI0030EF0F41